MSAGVVFNEVWTEDHSPLPPPLPPFSSSLSLTPWERQEQADRATKTHSERQTDRGGEREGDGRGNRREQGPFFSVSFLHLPIHHHVITARADHRACEGHFKDFLPSWYQCQAFQCLCAKERVCVCVMCLRAMCVCVQGSRSGWMCCSPHSEKSLPTPTHNNPPQNYGFVVEDTPASLMHLKYVCLSADVCVCLHAFQGSHRRTAHQQRALDLDEGQRFCSS